MTHPLLRVGLIGSAALLSACEAPIGATGNDAITDGGFDGGPLEDGVANIWVSPDGCQYWVIDDGLEGYMAARLNRDGTPRCTTPEDRSAEVIAKDGSSVGILPEPRG